MSTRYASLPGWCLTCAEQRLRLGKLLRRNPSLRPSGLDELPEAYAIARLQAALALGGAEAALPTACPWSAEQVLETDYWPTA